MAEQLKEEKELTGDNVVEQVEKVDAEPVIEKTKEELKAEEDKLVSDIIAAQAELDALKKEHGLEEEKGIKKAISNFFDRRENREKVPVNKKKYIIMSILLGWMGAHRFYTKQYGLGLLYLATCWTGFPVSLVVIDVLIAIPMQPDENGNILL